MTDPASRPRFKHRFEYGVFRLIGVWVERMPYRLALGLAWGVAGILFHGVRFRRREALRRIRSVFGESMPAREVRRVAWISLRNLTFNAVEMLRVSRFRYDDLKRLMPNLEASVAGVQAAAASRGGRGGAIIGIPHMGNWDLVGSGCHLAGAPVFSVAARQRNPLMNDFINRQRSGHGMEVLERGAGILRQVVERLRSGQLFAILPDTRAREPGLLVPFLGGQANLARGMAAFARATGVPILPVTVRRVRWTRFHITLHEPVWSDPSLEKEEDLLRMTRSVLEEIDRAIQEHPEQWFWYNKRWVLDPL